MAQAPISPLAFAVAETKKTEGGSEKKDVQKKAPKLVDLDWGEVLQRAKKRALGGGIPGALAMGLQVGSLMWLRTTMNYQYRHGGTTMGAIKTLYKEGGIRRFYRGVGPALFQGPLSRFGDTAANAGMMSLLDSSEETRNLPILVKTFFASCGAAVWRIFLMPIDATKTVLQVEGKAGLGILGKKIRLGGPTVLWHGSLGAASATLAGHFPWFFVYNELQEHVPKVEGTLKTLGRNAVIGFSASVVSDTVSNSLRVVKTTKQTFAEPISYPKAVQHVIKTDGVAGLFGRGLKTRILSNGLQGALFSVLWRALSKHLFPDH